MIYKTEKRNIDMAKSKKKISKRWLISFAVFGTFLLASPDTITSLVTFVSKPVVQIVGLVLLIIGFSGFFE